MATCDLIRDELLKLEIDNRITAERVEEAARDPHHPLHGEFEWRDDVAGYQHRLDQARRLIVRVRVEYRTTPGVVVKACVYMRDPKVPHHEQGYVRVSVLSQNEHDAHGAMMIELTRASAILTRAREQAAALGLRSQVDAIVQALNDLLSSLEDLSESSTMSNQSEPV
jgi:hypothetical protein